MSRWPQLDERKGIHWTVLLIDNSLEYSPCDKVGVSETKQPCELPGYHNLTVTQISNQSLREHQGKSLHFSGRDQWPFIFQLFKSNPWTFFLHGCPSRTEVNVYCGKDVQLLSPVLPLSHAWLFWAQQTSEHKQVSSQVMERQLSSYDQNNKVLPAS